MVLTDIDDNTRTGTIVLRPNNSWSWRANLWFLCILLVVSFSIATGFLIAGAWVILPFTVIEMSVLGLCIHYCVKQCSRQEVITVSDHEVKIERGIRGPSEHEVFQRMWAKFFVKKPRHPWDPLKLSIASHGIESEIGAFLNQSDKSDLVKQLQRVIPR